MRPFLLLLKGEKHCTLYITVPCPASTAPTRQFQTASHLEGTELSELFNPIQLKMSDGSSHSTHLPLPVETGTGSWSADFQ